MRFLVTGAAGRLGGKVAAALRGAGRHVVGVDRVAEPLSRQPAAWDEYVRCDLAAAHVDGEPRAALARALVGVDTVVHCAAWPGPSATPPPAVAPEIGAAAARSIGLEACPPALLLVDNVAMTAAVCDLAVAAGARRLVFSSSAFAMGWSHACAGAQALTPAYLPMDEAHAPRPSESYGLSKLMGEQILQAAAQTAKGTSFVSLRFTNVIKAERWAELPWPAPTPDAGFPLLFWAYAHEDDVVGAHVQAVQRLGAAQAGCHEAYLLAAPDTRFSEGTRALLASAAGLGGVPEVSPIEGNASVLCSRKARARLGWAPRSWSAEQRGAPLPRGEERGGRAAVRARADPELRRLSLGGLALECGGVLPQEAEVTYKLYGAPPDAGAGRGLVLHPTSYDAVHSELEYRIGPGKALDTSRNAVLVVNLLGNGVSLSPSNAPPGLARANFPRISVADNVRAQAAVLRELGVDVEAPAAPGAPPPLRLIFGYSMGGLQAYEWAVAFPHAAQAIAVVCGAARCSPLNQNFLLSLQAALTADGRYNAAERAFDATPAAGLRAFARVYSYWGVGRAFYERRLFQEQSLGQPPNATVADFVRDSYEAGFAGSDADDLLCQADTWLRADVGRHAGGDLAAALGRVRARVLLMPCVSDEYFTLAAAQEEAALLGSRAVLRPIESAYGHRAGDPHRRGLEGEDAFIAAHVRALLDGSL